MLKLRFIKLNQKKVKFGNFGNFGNFDIRRFRD